MPLGVPPIMVRNRGWALSRIVTGQRELAVLNPRSIAGSVAGWETEENLGLA